MPEIEETTYPTESEQGDTEDAMVPAELLEVYEINEYLTAIGEEPL